MNAAIEVKAVRKTFRVKGGLLGADRHVVAVDDISYAVPQGGVLGVVDLPQPDSPTTPKTPPGGTAKETSSTATT